MSNKLNRILINYANWTYSLSKPKKSLFWGTKILFLAALGIVTRIVLERLYD